MGRFDPIYTDEQRQAIATAVLEQDMTAKQACNALNAGQLDATAPSSPMPISTASAFAKKARREQRERAALIVTDDTDPRHAVARVYSQLLTIVNREIDRQQTASKQGKAKLIELDRLITAATKLEALASNLARTKQPPSNANPSETNKANGHDTDNLGHMLTASRTS